MATFARWGRAGAEHPRYDESREVSQELIKTILDCARWPPARGNGQPWEFVVVRDHQVRHKTADDYFKQMEIVTMIQT